MSGATKFVSNIVGGGLGGSVLGFFASLAISYITQKLFAPDVPADGGASQKDPGVKQRIPADTSNKLPVIYGEDKVHGSIIYADISQDRQTMAFIIALCEGPINEIGDVYWDHWRLTLDSNGVVTNATDPGPGNNTDSWLNGNLTIKKYPHGGRCSEMEAFSGKWNANAENRQMPDVAYVYAELKYDRENSVTGLTPKLGFEVQGRTIRQIINSTTVIGPEPKETPLTDNTNLAIFDQNTNFSDFNGRQILHFSTSGIFPSNAIGNDHQKVHTNGTLQIVDLGIDPSTGNPVSITDYLNGTAAALGSGINAAAELVFVEPGEHHTSNHSSNSPIYTYWQPTGYTDPNTGVSYPDDGYRIINGLKITNWGENYSNSSAATGGNYFTVYGIYTYTDNLGVNGTYYFPLVTYAFNTGSTEEQKRDNLLNRFSFAYTSDPYNYGYRRKSTGGTDSAGNTFQGVYQEHQQWFTAKLPYIVGEAARGYYTSNPAECLLDYLTNKIYGCGQSISDDDIDLETFYNHKLFCDDLVSHNDQDGNPTTSKRYQCNGFVNTNDTKDMNISDIISNSQSIFSYTLGKFQMISDTTGSNIKTFDETNIYGGVTLLNDGFNSALNQMNLQFKSKSNDYQSDQVFIDYTDKYYNEPILSKDLNLKFINTNIEAQRLGTVIMNKSRNNKIVSFKTDTRSANLQVNDIVTIKGTYYNHNNVQKFSYLYNNSQSSLSSTANPGRFTLYNHTEGKNVYYEDGTEAKLVIPYSTVKLTDLIEFYQDCINGVYLDDTGTLTESELKQNNKLGEIFAHVYNDPNETSQGTYGGKLIFICNPKTFSYSTQIEFRINVDTNISGTSFYSYNLIQSQTDNGSQFKINSISEMELEGGVQGYNITAQTYDPADYTVGTLTSRAATPKISTVTGYTSITAPTLTLNAGYPSASIPYVDISITMPNTSNVEGVEVYYADSATAPESSRVLVATFNSPTGTYTANSTHSYDIIGIPTTADLYIWVRGANAFTRSTFSNSISVGAWSPANASTSVGTNSVSTSSIQTGAVTSTTLANTLDLSTKTVILPSDAVTDHTGLWNGTIQTADFTIANTANWQGYFVDTTSNTVTITLPASSDTGDIIKIIDVGANAATNNIILDGNGNNIQGSASNYNITTNRSGTEFIYLTGQGWVLTNVH